MLLAIVTQEVYECFIETGVLHRMGLRNTLEPDPDNAGVGSFRRKRRFVA